MSSQPPKKISFGFTKVVKKHDLSKPKQNNVELIECIEAKTIKVVGNDENKTKKGPLVIPMKQSGKSGYGVLSNLISIIKEETGQIENTPTGTVEQTKSETDDKPTNGNESLDALAAKEILNELKKTEMPSTKVFNVPLTKEVKLSGEKESSLDDYENIPIADFGLAMLRGMGWEEGKGVGKNEKQVMVGVPELRPKGLGLGADRPTSKVNTNHNKSDNKEEDLQIKKGAYVRIVMGKNVDAYGQIEGLDDDAGRLFVKMALGGNKLSLNEFMVEPVTKTEYDKNARVLNSKKYEEYKNKDSSSSKGNVVKQEVDCDNDVENISIKKKVHEDKKNDRAIKERHNSSDEEMQRHSKYEHSDKREDKHNTKHHKSKKSHKKHKKSKRYSSQDSDSSEDRKKDNHRRYSPDRKKSSHRSEEKYSRNRQRRSRSREKKYKESRYRD